MKTLLIGLLTILSISASASVCEIDLDFDPVANKVKVYLEDKEQASENNEMIISVMGGNPKKLNCVDLITVIKENGVRLVPGANKEVRLQLVHLINL